MLIKKLSMAVAVGASLWTASPARAQVSMAAECSPGIPDCASVRFFIDAAGGVQINQLFIQLLNAGRTFTSGDVPTAGTYSAQDSFSPFGGFTTIGGGGTNALIDFTENGFPFEVLPGDTGLLDLQAAGGSPASPIWFTAVGSTADGGRFAVSVTPEPSTVVLVATGFALLLGFTRRRARLAM